MGLECIFGTTMVIRSAGRASRKRNGPTN